MGLPGAGKTTLASKLVPILDAEWLNADKIRKKYNFSDDDYIVGSFQRDTEGKGKNQPKLSKGPDQFLKIVKELNLEKPVSVILTGYRRSYLIKELQKENINFYYFEKDLINHITIIITSG